MSHRCGIETKALRNTAFHFPLEKKTVPFAINDFTAPQIVLDNRIQIVRHLMIFKSLPNVDTSVEYIGDV